MLLFFFISVIWDLKIAQKGHFVAISGFIGSKLVKHSVSRRNKSWHIRSDAINSHFIALTVYRREPAT